MLKDYGKFSRDDSINSTSIKIIGTLALHNGSKILIKQRKNQSLADLALDDGYIKKEDILEIEEDLDTFLAKILLKNK